MQEETPVDSNLPELQRVRDLPCWNAVPDAITSLGGGITNRNYCVDVGDARFVVRLGGDIPANHVMRFNEHAASRAAGELGLSPVVRYTDHDVLVIDFIPCRTLTPPQVADHLPGIVALMKRTHREMARQLRGPAMSYWLFHVIQDNIHALRARSVDTDLQTLEQQARTLEEAVGPVRLAYCHNDWLAANVLDDGQRLWLIDWDYAGFNSPLADLGSLASNNQLTGEQEHWLLENYDECPLSAERHRSYLAMKAASLLKETLWSMMSEGFSTIDFDYASYTRMNLARYGDAWSRFCQA